ncbi:MAG: restriction endonuclease subunit S, partial [Clostridiaceae bacterium]
VHMLGDDISSLDAGVSVNSIEGDVHPGDYTILKTSAISKGKFNPLESKLIRPRDLVRAKLNPKANSIIISRMNTPELVGECGYVEKDYSTIFLPDRLWQTTLSRNSNLNCKWLNYMLNTYKYRKIIKDAATGTSNTMKNISKDQILSIKVPYPDPKEQNEITTILSDIDNLINLLSKLISKKKNIKRVLMQELLTGRKRLEGYSGEWKGRIVGDIGKAYGGLTGKTKVDFGEGNSKYIPFMNIMSNSIIDMNFIRVVNIKDRELQNTAKYGDLFFNTSSETPEEVGMCSALMEETENLYLNSFCFGFRLNDLGSFNPLFLSYLFRSDVGRKLMFSLAQGATRYNLSKSNFYRLEINTPEIEEQNAIVNILSDIDKGIESLEHKLSKYKNIKQGMMQELLTGRIRLI